MRGAAVLAGLFAVPASAAQGARDAIRVEPTSQWVVDYADERCSIVREFGSGENAIRLQIDTYGTWNGLWVILSGPLVPRIRKPYGFARYRLPGDPKPREESVALFGSVNEHAAVRFSIGFSPYMDNDDWEDMNAQELADLAIELRRPFPDYDRSISSIEIILERGDPISFQVSAMDKPLAALRACLDDLYRSWGIDPAAQKALSRVAVPQESSVERLQRNYPAAQKLRGITAFIPFRLKIDAEGNATECVVQSEAVEQAFRDAVCNSLASQFEPAHNAAGEPAPSLFHSSMIYGLGW